MDKIDPFQMIKIAQSTAIQDFLLYEPIRSEKGRKDCIFYPLANVNSLIR
jgi:hypothetical protein